MARDPRVDVWMRQEREEKARLDRESNPFKTSAEIEQVAKDRQITALLAESTRRGIEVEQFRSAPLSGQDRNPYSHLTQSELESLDRLQRLEAQQRTQFEAQYLSMGSWVLLNPTFPASTQAAETIVNWCRQRNLSLAHSNLDAGWADLRQSGALRADFSRANAQQHQANVEGLRADGFNVIERPDPSTADVHEMEAWLKSQPEPTLSLLMPTVPAPDPFDTPLAELNRLNTVPEPDPWN